MKRSKDELIADIQGMDISDDTKMKLLEDVADSFEEPDMSSYVEKSAYDELKEKYISRFSEGAKAPEKEPEKEPEPEVNPDDMTFDDIFEEVD